MPRTFRPFLGTILSLLLAVSAAAQQPGIQWQQDIETAKATARQSNRLVLVHVVADGCGPCAALEKNVFNQPGVAAAIEQQFVPVKLNANEYPGIATGFGITRVPTDVIITPDGQILSKTISPPTPMGYVAEANAVATKYASQNATQMQPGAGQAYVAANAPNLQGLNPAYANLKIGEATHVPPMSPAVAGTAPPAPATTSMNPYAAPAAAPAPQPATVMNGYAAPAAAPATASYQAPITPVPTNPAANPYGSYAPPNQAPAATTTPQYGYGAAATTAPPAAAAPPDASVPPSNLTSPVLEEAQRPATTQQAAAVPDPSKLPPGAPPLGFDGYCPVSMRKAWKWAPGDPKYGAIHLGRTYWFAGPQEQQEFLANPDFYSPALAGIDPVLALDHRQSVPGLREHSLDYDGQFYLFSSEATLQQFTSSPERYASGVRQAMQQQTQQTR
ncbi:MAG: thioredoxin family protein [Pirellulales bacterium]